MIKVERLKIIVYTVVASIFITGCEQEAAQNAPMQMPFKENTWVRKEAITKSKVFSDKQIEINSKVLEYILKNIERSYEKVFKFVKDIDNESLSSGKSININLIKKVLNE